MKAKVTYRKSIFATFDVEVDDEELEKYDGDIEEYLSENGIFEIDEIEAVLDFGIDNMIECEDWEEGNCDIYSIEVEDEEQEKERMQKFVASMNKTAPGMGYYYDEDAKEIRRKND